MGASDSRVRELLSPRHRRRSTKDTNTTSPTDSTAHEMRDSLHSLSTTARLRGKPKPPLLRQNTTNRRYSAFPAEFKEFKKALHLPIGRGLEPPTNIGGRRKSACALRPPSPTESKLHHITTPSDSLLSPKGNKLTVLAQNKGRRYSHVPDMSVRPHLIRRPATPPAGSSRSNSLAVPGPDGYAGLPGGSRSPYTRRYIEEMMDKVRKAKNDMKTVSVIDGALYIEYRFEGEIPDGMDITI